jgi:hypothetical protein
MVPLAVLPGVLNGIQVIATFVVAAIFALALLYALTHLVRTLGKKVEARLLRAWGGFPTAQWLLWSDPTLDPTTKAALPRLPAQRGPYDALHAR